MWPMSSNMAEIEEKRAPSVQREPLWRLFLVLSTLLTGLHLAFALFSSPSPRVSNWVQLAAALLVTAACWVQARNTPAGYLRSIWVQLIALFSLWSVGQACYLSSLLLPGLKQLQASSDGFFLLFGLGLLLVTSNSPRKTAGDSRDPVEWSDLAQGCLGLSALYFLVFARPAELPLDVAYNIQSALLLFAYLLRFLVSRGHGDRRIFRDLLLFVAIYGVCTWAGWIAGRRGLGVGTVGDLFWDLPFLIFAPVVMRRRSAPPRGEPADPAVAESSLSRNIRCLSSIGLTGIAIAASGALGLRRPLPGSILMALAILLFVVRTSTRERQLEKAHLGLKEQVLFDPLTGLASRVLLMQELTVALARARQRPFGEVAILFIDLDRFKIINDSLGYAFGNRLLVEVTRLLRSTIRPGDLLARLGSDEFVLLLREVGSERPAMAVAERIVTVLQAPITLDGRVTYITSSVGVAVAAEMTSAEEMVRHADCAMYEAKRSGKNSARLFAPSMLAKTSKGLELETDLRQALQDGSIHAWYQPIYSLAGDRVYGFEALVRWQHPDRGLISPADFISIAEDTGLVLDLGRQMLDQACHRMREWNERFQSRLSVSVNISARQFADPRLLDTILGSLRRSGLAPELLKLEITESVLLNDPQAAMEVLRSARELGIQICLDDFGTGYSSLSYLLDFPFDVVKIDRSFVKNMEQDRRRMEVVRTIIDLARQLEKQVIAEGVETGGELDCLRDLRCELVQGYLYSKPLPPEQMTSLLAADPTPASIREVHQVQLVRPLFAGA